MALTLSVAPAEEPVSRVEAKSHLRVDHSDDDTLIDGLIVAARQWAEGFLQRQLVTATWKLYLDYFPLDGSAIRLPLPPTQSVSSVQYIDEDGVLQTWDASKYILDKESQPARLQPAYEQEYPATRDVPNAVTITFVAGYGLAAAVPGPHKSAIKLVVAELYERREQLVIGAPVSRAPFTAEALLWPDRMEVL